MKETFGQRFQRLRKNAGFTQEDIATKLNITAQAVSKWENDASAPDISVLAELSDILNVSLDELLGKTTPETVVVPAEQRKDINSMLLKMRISSSDGDKVSLNLPLALVKMLVTDGTPLQINTKINVMSQVDFDQVVALVEQGVVGKIMEVQSSEGDTVEIWVE